MRSHYLLVVVSSLVLTSSLHAANSPNYAKGSRSVAIEGITCPEIEMWSGGDPIGNIWVEQSATGAIASKQIGLVLYQPIVLQASVPFSRPLLECVADLCAGRTRPVTLLLSSADHNGTTIGDVIEAPNAVLSEIRFPAIDRSGGRSAVIVTLIFQAGRTQVVRNGAGSNPASALSANSKRAMAGNLRVTIAGLDTSRVQGTGDFLIMRPVGTNLEGSSATEFGDFAVYLTGPAPDDWVAWRDSFLVEGNNDNPQEKSGAIELLSPDLKTVVFSVQFNNAGVKRLPFISDKPDHTSAIKAELYFETMSFANGPAALPATTTASTAPSTSQSAPAEAQSAPAEAAATEPAGTTVTNPEDQGARDPADFPRPEGTVRTAFDSIRQRGTVMETGEYKSTQTAAELMEFYEKALGGSGWEEDKRNENNSARLGAHQIQTTWTKDNRTVNLTLVDTAPGMSEVQVMVKAKL